ncbi:hypothetical protein HG717_16385 [Rhodococcus erythropolis]|uniref:hypothetical protein n=1 Tax=Rhodococcus erythropolis TaxID=1833 RepID=UPI001C9B9EF7|nr:hypothetical protein [Rhodococcus erythropolis]MBY6385477.1 hypothetical protein [Rhodococcus erythropolis]
MSEIRSQATPARDELAEKVFDLLTRVAEVGTSDRNVIAHGIAMGLEDAGWSKPRTVNSAAELDALKPGTVLRFPDGEIGMIMVARDKRHVVGYPQCLLTNELGEVIRSAYGDPIRILFTPGDAGHE